MKFKNTKKKAKSEKSPSNSRAIPASFKISFPKLTHKMMLKIYHGSLNIFIILIFILTAIIVGVDLQKNLIAKSNIDSQRKNLTSELNFWRSFIVKHNDYRDAYFQASILEYKLGDTSQAKLYADKGLILDPNSTDGKKLEDLLTNK